jgi:formamidopyrimidine-DNA glycosylase
MKNTKNGKRKIAVVLMDQSVFSGVGNYLKSEILYQARVSPHATINNIPDEKILEIFEITLKKINESYKSGGASVRDYSDIKGKEGTFSFTFAVYKKKKDPFGNKIVMEKTKDGRTTHWVPELQESFDK